MECLPNDIFLERLAVAGITPDRRYQPPHTLVYPTDLSLHVPLDGQIRQLRALISRLFDCLLGEDFYLWRRGGRWEHVARPGKDDADLATGALRILHALGCRDIESAIVCRSEDRHEAACLMLLTAANAWKVTDDVFLIPLSGRFIAHFDHDDYVHVRCRDVRVRDEMSNVLSVAVRDRD